MVHVAEVRGGHRWLEKSLRGKGLAVGKRLVGRSFEPSDLNTECRIIVSKCKKIAARPRHCFRVKRSFLPQRLV